jgi:PAS domain S-box-containing protein
MSSVRILIADDHEIVRRGIRSLFTLRPDWNVCGEAVDGREAVEKAKQLLPDIVLLDISMPFLNGLEAARIIRREVPQSRVLIVSQYDATHMRAKALEAGASGYVAKSDLSRELLAAVEATLDELPSPATQSPEKEAAEQPRSSPVEAKASARLEAPPEFLLGGGEMGALMRSMDWRGTKLGPPENWPESLRACVRTALNSHSPVLIWWGPEWIMLYNDECRQLIGPKHPAAMGSPGADCWEEKWGAIHPALDRAYHRGESSVSNDVLALMAREQYLEEAHFSFSCTPIREQSGRIGGVFTTVSETTDRVIGERRMRTLHDLAVHAMNAGNEDEAWKAAAETLGKNLFDIPFCILCRPEVSENRLRTVECAAIDKAHVLCSMLADLESPFQRQVDTVLESGAIVEVGNLEALAVQLPCGSWQVPPREALLLPFSPTGRGRPAGILLAAVSPRKSLDTSYRTFFELIAGEITRSITNARASARERGQAEARSHLAAIVESSDDAIISKDLRGTILTWNQGAQRLFGYSAQEAIGRSITLIIPPELREEEVRILRSIGNGERIEHFETVRVTKSGTRVHVSLSVSPLRDAAGNVVGASKIARDITERRQNERALKNVHEELEARVKERTLDLERAEENLRILSSRLLQMQDEERRRIARELHDTAGQVMAALNMNLAPLEEQLKTIDPVLAKPVTESIELVNDLSVDLRTISHLLHPPLLDEAGLESALQWFVEGFAERSRVPVDLDLSADFGRLTPEMETTIFRVVQECLTNVHRHSGSATASISVRREANGIRLEIRDYGKGMGTSPLEPARSGVGIQGMRERVRQLNGQFSIQSGNTGTVVTVVLPEASSSARKAVPQY